MSNLFIKVILSLAMEAQYTGEQQRRRQFTAGACAWRY
jgi:hypothetical protein